MEILVGWLGRSATENTVASFALLQSLPSLKSGAFSLFSGLESTLLLINTSGFGWGVCGFFFFYAPRFHVNDVLLFCLP